MRGSAQQNRDCCIHVPSPSRGIVFAQVTAPKLEASQRLRHWIPPPSGDGSYAMATAHGMCLLLWGAFFLFRAHFVECGYDFVKVDLFGDVLRCEL